MLLLLLPLQMPRVILGCTAWPPAQLQRMVRWRWALLSTELVFCLLLYLIITIRGELASCHMVKRCFQDIVLVPMCTLIISPLIMRRQLWLSGMLLALTIAIVTHANGLAASVAVRSWYVLLSMRLHPPPTGCGCQ